MWTLPKHSLRLRVALAFALFSAILSFLLSSWLYWASDIASLRLMDETLRAELDDYRARRQRNPYSLPPATITLLGYVNPAPPGSPSLPEALTTIAPGTHLLMLNQVSYRLLVEDWRGDRYYMLYNKSRQAERATHFRWVLASGILIIALLASLVGFWLAGQLIAPVSALAMRVQALNPEAIQSPLAEDFPQDELNVLADAFDHYRSRLRDFIERERAFAADVSHELRTPLSIIQGVLEIELENTGLTLRQHQRLLRAHRAAQNMAEMTTALLVLAREQPLGVATPTVVADVIQEAVDRHRHLLDHKPTAVHLRLDPAVKLNADRALILIVVSNLVRNAFQYTDQGQVAIDLGSHHLRVKDTGQGIDADDLMRIFQRHHKGSNSRGEGIGLSLTKRICDRYGWHIIVSSCNGCGTEVALYF